MASHNRRRLSSAELTSTCQKKIKSAKLTIGGQQPVSLSKQPNNGAFRADLNFALERVSQELLCLSVTYLTPWYQYWKSKKRLQFTSSEVLDKSQDSEYRAEAEGLCFILKYSPESAEAERPVRTNPEPLSPTIEGILRICPRFRILVIGKSGVGKTTLIKHAFGIQNAFTEHGQRGLADIKTELISEQNNRFILHDSRGFEHGDVGNLDLVTDFIRKRRTNQDVKEQLHAVWLCFQIPNDEAGQRIMETGMEEFLQKKEDILGNVPTIFVFTKHDMLTTAIEYGFWEQKQKFNSEDIELIAKRHLEERCIEPIQRQLTEETNFPYIAVAAEQNYKLKELIQLTYKQVFEYFGDQPGPGTSAVPTLAAMAQRVAPDLKIKGSIEVGKERYWKAIFSGTYFSEHSIQDCIGVIHADIVKLWNFHDDDQLLQSVQFRDVMLKLVDLLYNPADLFDHRDHRAREPQRKATTSSMQDEGCMLVAFLPIILPFSAGLSFVKWAYNIYSRTPDVQRKFMAYIVDLTNVLDILFTLTSRRNQENLNIRTIKVALITYYKSMRRNHVHTQIRECSVGIFGSSGVVTEIESLLSRRYVVDEELVKAIEMIAPENLEREEAWWPSK